MSVATEKRIKVLFLAWGYSIHAKRRIQIFVDDPTYEVAVVSTYDYNFSGALNVLLPSVRSLMGRILASARYRSRHFFLFRLLEDLWKSLLDLVQLLKVVKKFCPDVIFLQTLLYPCYLALLLPRSIPMVVTFWNGDVTWWAKWDGIEQLLKKQIVTRGVRRAQAMTVNSRAAYDACLSYNVPAKKVHLIRYPGVDLDRFQPASRQAARQSLGLECGRVILCPRGVGGYLNSDVIIEAAAAVIAMVPETLFLFISGAGGESEWQQHLQRATELGIADHLRRDGQIPWEGMPLYYQAADVVISISSNDSLPNCMLEAMACGIPLVMGDIPQIREWVIDGVNGLLAPPRDPDLVGQALLLLLEDNDTLAAEFVRYNLDLVSREFDSRKNALVVKQLVNDIAERNI